MEEVFKGTATCPDGREFTAEGTIMEMANWADNVIRCNRHEIIVNITRKEGEKDGNASD